MLSEKQRPEFAARGAADDQIQQGQTTTQHRVLASISQLVTKSDLEHILQIDSRTIDRMRSSGRLPKPDLFLARSPRWKASTISEWIERGAK